MRLSELDYELPAERIAQKPLPERDASRMLVLGRRSGAWEDRAFRELPELARGDELVVLNNARVLPARLFGRRQGVRASAPDKNPRTQREFLSADIEVLLVRRRDERIWEALVRPGRKIGVGERIVFDPGKLEAEVKARGAYGLRVLQFEAAGDFAEQISRLGHVPLPPYIKREDQAEDGQRYQTVYARSGAAAAAPTAGLHFTQQILDRLRAKRVEIAEITLEVGLGTFEPVRTEQIEDHRIHAERYTIPEATSDAIAHAKAARRPVLAIGTTVVRALEDAAERAERGIGAAGQRKGALAPGSREAEIFLYPGKPFRIVDLLLTNFHLPRSSLLALVCAFAGRENVLAAYRHAVQAEYRFYSYGDCMLIR